MDDRIKNVLAIVFRMDFKEIGNDASPQTINVWDSLKHMQIILALEDEFNVRFEENEFANMMSFEAIRSIIKGKRYE